ncbi:hypothetical protein [Phyllobacterium bourgognense]|uniref:Uncharacterized protein n=1 Tax=Phyllobacterium bourgognense TaxID=314236 RepID=A0A368Z5D4_9HYPH|nr:hypothetical protein [Phyllobacterium bourgognense]RCW87601.1 hypothetical protein C7476_101367 [Phyllobacterium bourgognense]
MTKDISSFTLKELQNLIANHRRQSATNDPLYLAAIEEHAKRIGNGLSFGKTLGAIVASARGGCFLGYRMVADESGADWNRVHWSMGKHLGELLEFSHRRGWPLLTSIVVNQRYIKTGEMEPESLAGFVEIARRLGFQVVDEVAFLREQQLRVFAWARDTDFENLKFPAI